MNIYEESLKFHKDYKGKIEIKSRVKAETSKDLSLAYTPGVAEPCREIHKNPEAVYEYTRKWNTVAVISDGTAVLGLGDIGPLASLPVMEGKCVLFKEFADVDAFPIILSTTDVDEIVSTIVNISPTFGGINLEDIAAPRCFEIEAKLKEKLNIPVFHDDQHGTAIVVLAGLLNALKVVSKSLLDIKVVVNGAGSAGCAITKLLLLSGIKNIVVVDRAGILTSNEEYSNPAFTEISSLTNPNKETGLLSDAMKNADVFIGVSAPNIVSKDMVSSMNKDSIVFAMANPTPEIFPEDALDAGARIVGTGRSDYPNQINNVLAFPGIFRGALDARLPEITDEIKVACAYAIANSISDKDLSETYIIPKAFDLSVQKNVASAVRNFK
ncbi:malic enzyme-like NAD(P)-binding protein [uncultured Clostridium sp.]|jgi:malate dehydrogenase (oxaloacetate-decarboxylating)|uniref:NAD(P)-dependent malic enzyme n=1 Tax=uncultured Clostridium sp. TaxID=59620 RepID=UPI0026385F1A|nr:malic enzyme-like NAD(P)-binding protein [uncultured Clostridium sp.]